MTKRKEPKPTAPELVKPGTVVWLPFIVGEEVVGGQQRIAREGASKWSFAASYFPPEDIREMLAKMPKALPPHNHHTHYYGGPGSEQFEHGCCRDCGGLADG